MNPPFARNSVHAAFDFRLENADAARDWQDRNGGRAKSNRTEFSSSLRTVSFKPLFFSKAVRALKSITNETGNRDRHALEIARYRWRFPLREAGKMEFQDRVLKCTECGAEFVFTAGEQVFFHDKQFKNDRKYCKQCKAKRTRGSRRVRPETRTTCSECGAETTVPFKPTQGRPVLCRSCFQKLQKGQPATRPTVSQD